MGSINRFCILIVVMVALVSSANSAANSETATQVPELLDQPLKHEYIWAAGAPSVELRAKLELALESTLKEIKRLRNPLGKTCAMHSTLKWIAWSRIKLVVQAARKTSCRLTRVIAIASASPTSLPSSQMRTHF
jgi:hypothetical protein